ncbi:hypothetical protein [Listeria seeligeri]|uniref:hypothetical protein n=1 Tax=Listeria seeligeri TaxID=1640 RepID=UPI001888E9F5|nr:hypothetical protein [Listeria seeligeri]MBF2563121.1 hypothetical protein [Listeria seeligeri]
MTQTKMRNTIDETYKKLRNKLKTDEEITESDLLESLKLYEITNKELKKAKNKYRKWTEDEDAYLAYFACCNDAKIQDAADYLERTLYSVENRLEYLRKTGEVSYMRPRWTQKEDKFIREHYSSLSLKDIAKRLNRSYSAIKRRAWVLSVKREAEAR